MSDKTKRIISNTVTGIVGIYGFLSIIMYVYPAWGPIAMSMVMPLTGFFLTIPVGIVLGCVLLLAPLAILILLVVLVEVVSYKLMGLEHDMA